MNVKRNCFLVDYMDKQGQCRNQGFSCLSPSGSMMQDARGIMQMLTRQGYTVTMITFVPGKWTPQQLEKMADGTSPAIPGTSPIYADFEAIRRSYIDAYEADTSTRKPFAVWLIAKYCSSTWEGSRYSMDAYGKEMSVQENIQTLAFDILRDFGFPRTSTDKQEILYYFKKMHASSKILDTVNRALALYEKEIG